MKTLLKVIIVIALLVAIVGPTATKTFLNNSVDAVSQGVDTIKDKTSADSVINDLFKYRARK